MKNFILPQIWGHLTSVARRGYNFWGERTKSEILYGKRFLAPGMTLFRSKQSNTADYIKH